MEAVDVHIEQKSRGSSDSEPWKGASHVFSGCVLLTAGWGLGVRAEASHVHVAVSVAGTTRILHNK